LEFLRHTARNYLGAATNVRSGCRRCARLGAPDGQSAALRFIGIEDIEIVRAEGVAYGPEQCEAALRAALSSVPAVVSGDRRNCTA
jgi:hypothetical protein